MRSEKNDAVILFCSYLYAAGGAERLLFEEAEFLKTKGLVPLIFAFKFNHDVMFNDAYEVSVEQVGQEVRSANMPRRLVNYLKRIYLLRRRIREVRPNLLILATPWDCIFFYFATFLTPARYATHIHGTVFWQNNLFKYARVYAKVFDEIRNSVAGHKEFIPEKRPQMTLIQRIVNEAIASCMYLGVRRAVRIFVLSNQMKWEVNKLYKKEAVVLKGAFPDKILNYTPKKNFKKALGCKGNLIISISRLDPRKRIDLLIRSFKLISEKRRDLTLVIGGTGPDEQRLKKLAHELNIQTKVKFIGYVQEQDLWDWLASCDVFVHPNWAEFAIAPYEALALQKKVVWSTEMETDRYLANNRHIFAANPEVSDLAAAIERALNTEVDEVFDMSRYTWHNYCESVISKLQSYIYSQ